MLAKAVSKSIDGDNKEKQKYSAFTMIAFGFGEVFGCFFIGFIVDRFGSKLV